MLDIHFIRGNIDAVKKNNHNRGVEVDVDHLIDLDEKRRSLIAHIEERRAVRNKTSKGKPSEDEIKGMRIVGEDISRLEAELNTTDEAYRELLQKIPNLTHSDVPIGKDETENKVIREVGKIPSFNFPPKEHWVLGQALDIIDTSRATKVSGNRLAYLKGGLAMLEFALIQFALSVLTSEKTLKKIIKKAGLSVPSKPFVPVIPPVFIRPEVFQKMGRLEPKDERYYIPSDDLYLIGSAEHTLGSMHMDETLESDSLPIRYVGFSTAFRREAGSYGKDTKGITRMHQFDKLELESFTSHGDSLHEQDFFVAIQEYFMQELELPYRVVAICTGDMGAPDFRQIDIEAWLPGLNQYRETHTADLVTDFQSRRLNIKVSSPEGTELAHMNDATAIAMSRIPIAIIENYQTEKGTVKIPKVLQKYMGGLKVIG